MFQGPAIGCRIPGGKTRAFSLIVFGVHVLFELAFGVSAYLSGAPSSQSAEQIAAQTDAMTISFRFLGSALIALCVLGALVFLISGARSATARVVAAGFCTLHGPGAFGSMWTAAPDFTVNAAPLSLGAVTHHGLLVVGFAVIATAKAKAA